MVLAILAIKTLNFHYYHWVSMGERLFLQFLPAPLFRKVT